MELPFSAKWLNYRTNVQSEKFKRRAIKSKYGKHKNPSDTTGYKG